MKRVDIIELYASDDIHYCMGALQKYMYVDGAILLQGSSARNIDDMIIGAKALLHFEDGRFDLNVHQVAHATLYYAWNDQPEKLYEYIMEDKPQKVDDDSSGYGNF